ncbi:MAG: hypothetical protein MJ068_04780 [Clostridia bacterium]|nr:hypothetical protein [Clostridia bacterium]
MANKSRKRLKHEGWKRGFDYFMYFKKAPINVIKCNKRFEKLNLCQTLTPVQIEFLNHIEGFENIIKAKMEKQMMEKLLDGGYITFKKVNSFDGRVRYDMTIEVIIPEGCEVNDTERITR